MATKTLHLSVFFYPNATGHDDIMFAQALLTEAEQLFCRYCIGLDIWPPKGNLGQFTVLSKLGPGPWNPDEPNLLRKEVVKAFDNLLVQNFSIGLITRLPVVFGRFDTPQDMTGATYPDDAGLPLMLLKAICFIQCKHGNIPLDPQRKSTLAHEIGHAADCDHLIDYTELMYSPSHYLEVIKARHDKDPKHQVPPQGAGNRVICDRHVLKLKGAFFAW